MDALKLLGLFFLIIIALRKRLPVSVTLFGAGIAAALLYGVPFSDVLDGYLLLISSARFWSLTGVIVLVTSLGAFLKNIGYLKRLTTACRLLYGGRRSATALLPMLVGMMPMPGGALLSAPLVNSVLSPPQYSPEFKCAVNYWYRHVLEHVMPVYPGMIIAAAMTGLPLGTLAVLHAPFSIIMLIVGYFLLIRRIDKAGSHHRHTRRGLLGIASTIWPILLAVSIYAIFSINMVFAVMLAFLAVGLVARPAPEALWRSLKKGLSFKLVFLVFGILSFQTVLEQSGAIEAIQQLSSRYGLPEEVIIIAVGFASGLLTGMLAALVALSYSLLAGFLYVPDYQWNHLVLAFLAGYTGMILSPSHLCLIITNDYFGSELIKVYRVMIIPVIVFALLGYAVYSLGWGQFVSLWG
jgi:integral membrane protein (TIGR00529 family)